MPFAEAPIGKLRLQPSILKTQLGVRQFNATRFGFACIQPVRSFFDVHCQFPSLSKGLPTELMSEDCLTINVLRPSGISSNTKLPVVSVSRYRCQVHHKMWDSCSGRMHLGDEVPPISDPEFQLRRRVSTRIIRSLQWQCNRRSEHCQSMYYPLNC